MTDDLLQTLQANQQTGGDCSNGDKDKRDSLHRVGGGPAHEESSIYREQLNILQMAIMRMRT
jgi:hypothetical protein